MTDEQPEQWDHEITEDGESTTNWHCNHTKFWGTAAQLTCCARCGRHELKGHHEPRHFRDVGKPTIHLVCDACYEELLE